MVNPRFSLLALLFVSLAFPQAPTGEISGTITDATGALVAGAKVTLNNTATNQTRVIDSNESGLFRMPALPPGIYNIRVEKPGFGGQTRNSIELQTGQVASLDFQLTVGNVTEMIEVTTGAPVLDTEGTSVGTVIENKRIVELPLNGRNYLQLASLIPGATTNGPASSQGQQRMGGSRNTFALNVAGQRVHYNHYTLDGVENTDPNFNTYLLLPSVDALQEFKVESGVFQAEYGRAIAQINVSTKSGGNAFHGAAFEFLRNSAMDAKNFFDRAAQPIPPFKRNQFGGTATGPVIKNRLFWLFSYEGLRERKALTQTGVLPNSLQRVGDFSNQTAAVVDPLTKVPYPGNRLPASQIQALSTKILNDFYPLPNLTGGALNFISNEGRRSDADQYHARIDFQESGSSNWFFRYSQASDPQYLPSLTSIAPGMGNNVKVDAKQPVIANTRLFGSNKVNEFRFAVNRFVSQNIQTRANTSNIVAGLNIPGVDTSIPLFWGIPFFQISNFSSIGECNDCPFVNWNTSFQVKDDFSWTRGKHQFKFGGEFRRLRYNQIGAVVPRGRFTWNGQYSGNSMADMLLGYMSNSESQIGAPIANFRENYYALFLQDSWKISSKLTMNVGLRWEAQPPYLDKHDAIVNIDYVWDNSHEPIFVRAGTGNLLEGNPKFPVGLPFKLVRDGRFGRRAFKSDWNDFAPRLGIAYQMSSKTVLRGGAGIYYVRDISNAVFDIVRNIPFTIRQNEVANSVTPNLTWQRPFTQTGAPTFILANQFGEPSSYVAQWSIGVQREITRNSSLEINYMGSAGIHLRRLQVYNSAPPGPGATNSRRPFTYLNGNIQTMNAPAHSSYNSLQARFQHRFSHGFTLLSSYAWGRTIDNGSGVRTTDGDALTPSNNYNLRAERGLSAFQFKHRLTNSFLYELPVGKGKRYLGSASRAADMVLGGWQLGGIITLQSGFPASIFCGPGNWQNNDTTCYADATGINPDLPSDQRGPSRWFNLAAFANRVGIANNRPQDITAYRYGNAGRNVLIGPRIVGVDMSVAKNFMIGEKSRVELRGEFFNLPNHPIFGNPGTSPGSTTYGVIGGTRIDPRDVQIALKFVF